MSQSRDVTAITTEVGPPLARMGGTRSKWGTYWACFRMSRRIKARRRERRRDEQRIRDEYNAALAGRSDAEAHEATAAIWEDIDHEIRIDRIMLLSRVRSYAHLIMGLDLEALLAAHGLDYHKSESEQSPRELSRTIRVIHDAIREERSRRIKRIADTLIPVLSLIVAILGLMLAWRAK